jgi:two-component system cell cycle sensor histidine kinase/response regulator CckA
MENINEKIDGFTHFADNLSVGIAIVDMNGLIVYANEADCRFLGYSKEELQYMHFSEFTHPDDLVIDHNLFQQLINGQRQSYTIDKRYIKKDRAVVWGHLGVSLLFDSGDVPQFVVVSCEDIAERKLAEEKLCLSEKRYRAIMNQMPAAIFISDMNGNLIDANRQACDSLGYSQDELLRLSVADVDPMFSVENHPRNVWDKLPSPANITIESKHKRKDGSVYPVEIHIGKIDLDGEDAILGIARDITERKLAEEKIKKNEEFIRNILDTVDDGFIVVDRDYRIMTANKAYCGQVGLSCKEVVGRYYYEVSHPAERPCFETGEKCAVREAFAKGVSCTAAQKHLNKNAEILFIETKAFPNRDEAGNVVSVIATTRNITERHLLEAEQLKTQKIEAIGTLAGGIAHDFNNLLQGVFGYVSMAKMASNQPEKVIKMLDQAEKALSLSINLTTQLLTFAKGGNPVKKRVDLRPVIENVTKFALSGSRCNCRLHLDQDLWPAEVDEGQVAQVIQNIVLNASEAMPEGGVVDLSAENITLPEGGRQIRIAIKDSGIGIPRSYRSKIFDPYFTTKQKGSGLGLATSYSIIKNHGGSIEVVSAQNKGTTFFITLPACAPVILAGKPLQTSSGGKKQKRRILLMDDEALVRDVAKSMFETLGQNIELACHGEEVIDKYQRSLVSGNPFDLVILDLTIKGGMGGQETIRKLQEIDPKVNAVVSSGYSDNPIVSEYRDYGFKGLLNKPYSIKTLEDCLSNFVG